MTTTKLTTTILPNFLIIGAAKAGTIAFHDYLNQHPQIYMTPQKKTNFFALEGEKLNFQGPGGKETNHFSITTLSVYQAEFEGQLAEVIAFLTARNLSAWGQAARALVVNAWDEFLERWATFLEEVTG